MTNSRKDFFENVEGFFLIPRKYLEFLFFFFLHGHLEASFRRPENITIIAIIINHEYFHIPPLTSFPLTGTQPGTFSQPESFESLQHYFKTLKSDFATALFCALWLFSFFAASCLERICRPELSSTSLQQTPACRAHTANQPFSHGAVTDKLCQMPLPWFQIFMLTAVHLTVLLEMAVSLQGERGACVCTRATYIHIAC